MMPIPDIDEQIRRTRVIIHKINKPGPAQLVQNLRESLASTNTPLTPPPKEERRAATTMYPQGIRDHPQTLVHRAQSWVNALARRNRRRNPS
ncbi:hypothetical protein IMZ48_25445 [Candidatus Bathyarchaeota archaeon]|nr:hypothetical protein [Candidatus Bathyarchaeota archaeon]